MFWKIAGAPGAWGVEDPKNIKNPPYERVLSDASLAGYRGIELGPFGYLPQDDNILKEELEKYKLTIVAGTIYDDLLSEENFETVIEKTKITCDLLSKLPKPTQINGQRYETPYLVVIDAVNKIRNPFAGHPDEAVRLDKENQERLINHLRIVGEIAKSYGIRAVVHPHAGGYIEFSDEIDFIMENLSSEEIGLCLDTGHLFYSKMSPDKWIKKYSDRLDYVHFKDVHLETYEKVLASYTGFFEGCEKGVMCPIGDGAVGYKDIKDALTEIGYKGWITIEQERDPLLADGSLDDAKKSISFLNQNGYNL
jgi:inosose dehydratase